MPIQPGTLVWSSHRLLGEVTSPPPFGGIDVDVLWTTKAVHRIVHLNTFPAMIVVVLIEYKIKTGPTRCEKRVVTLLVRHVHQLVDVAPVVPLKTSVELWIALQRRILVDERPVGNSGAARATQRHVV